jgi:hypothetical protein
MNLQEVREIVTGLIRRRRKENQDCYAIQVDLAACPEIKLCFKTIYESLDTVGVDPTLFDWNINNEWVVGVWYESGEWVRGNRSISTSACIDSLDRPRVESVLSDSGMARLLPVAAVDEMDLTRALGPALTQETGEQDVFLVAEKLIESAGFEYVYYTNEKKYIFPITNNN